MSTTFIHIHFSLSCLIVVFIIAYDIKGLFGLSHKPKFTKIFMICNPLFFLVQLFLNLSDLFVQAAYFNVIKFQKTASFVAYKFQYSVFLVQLIKNGMVFVSLFIPKMILQ